MTQLETLETPTRRDPYPRKCYLPFILYPPGMYQIDAGTEWLESNVDMYKEGNDIVLYIGIPFCRTRCKSCPYFASLLPEKDSLNKEERYVNALIKDLNHWGSYPKFATG